MTSTRVLLRPLDDDLPETEAVIAWADDFERGCARGVRTHPIVRLTEDGIDYGTEPGPSDETGYGMDPYRVDDCLQAAIATVTQIPIEQVPDLDIDARRAQGIDFEEISRTSWHHIDNWATERGLTLRFHEQVPVSLPRWIGVVTPGTIAARDHCVETHIDVGDLCLEAADHCLVMCHDRLVFDPACSLQAPPGLALKCWTPEQISYGISFDKEE